MRTFEERMEEICRRSAVLQKKKKKVRQLVAATSCTLVFCGAGLWMAFTAAPPVVSSEIQLQDTTTPMVPSSPTVSTEKSEYSTVALPQLEISHSGEVYLCTDPERIPRIRSLLDSVAVPGDFSCTEEVTVGISTEVQDDCLADSVPDTRLVFTEGDGTAQIYTLEGSILTVQHTGKQYTLPSDTLQELNQLIRKDEMP